MKLAVATPVRAHCALVATCLLLCSCACTAVASNSTSSSRKLKADGFTKAREQLRQEKAFNQDLGLSQSRGLQRPNDPPASCKAFKPPPQYKGLQDYCKFLNNADSSKYQDMFFKAKPASLAQGFPLSGCVTGCLVGQSIFNDIGELPWNSGAWSGKCFQNVSQATGTPRSVINVISPGKEAKTWKNGLNGYLEYPAEFGIQMSRSDGRPVWTLDYANSTPFVGRSLKGFIDEMREVAPGFVLGEVWIRPYTLPYNPGPLMMKSLRFALFQACNAQGGYPATPAARVVP